jgi:hypothetical protein
VPDAGSRVARVLGQRWWAVLPMHVQYFTRASMQRLLQAHGFARADIATHPKIFSAGYYADRLAVLIPVSGRAIPAVLRRAHLTHRPVAPDLRDRMGVIATLTTT